LDKIKEELLDRRDGTGLLRTIWRYALFGAVVIVVAVYVGLLLFGTNSVEVLYTLKVQKKSLERSIKYLKKENARLQKEFFELKELEPTE